MLLFSLFNLIVPSSSLPGAVSAVASLSIRRAGPLSYDDIIKQILYGGVRCVSMVELLNVSLPKRTNLRKLIDDVLDMYEKERQFLLRELAEW